MSHYYAASLDSERGYIELRLSGIPQRDAANDAGVAQPRASELDRVYGVPTSRDPDRVPEQAPDWQPVTANCEACGHPFHKIDAGQRYCAATRHRCSQNHRRRKARGIEQASSG